MTELAAGDNQAASQQVTPPLSTSAPSPATARKLPVPRLWTIVRIAVYAVIALWSLISLFLLWQSGFEPVDILKALWVPAIFVIQFTLLTTPWRAVSAKDIGSMFLIGMSIVFLGAYLCEIALTNLIESTLYNTVYLFLAQSSLLGEGVDIMQAVSSPVVEEIFKVLPAVIFLLVAGRGYWKRALGPLDVGLLAGASGAGFLFMENLARVAGGWMSSLGWDRNWDSASIGINPFFIFPEMVHGTLTVWPGHAEMAMFIGVCLGFGLLIRKKLPVIWVALPAIALFWMMWLHFLINYLTPDNNQAWAQFVIGLHLNGGLAQYFMILVLLIAVAFSMITKYRYLQKDPEATVKVVWKDTQEYIRANQKQPLLIVKKLWSLRHFWAYRHAVAYGVFNAKQQKPEDRDKWAPWLYSLRQMAIGKE